MHLNTETKGKDRDRQTDRQTGGGGKGTEPQHFLLFLGGGGSEKIETYKCPLKADQDGMFGDLRKFLGGLNAGGSPPLDTLLGREGQEYQNERTSIMM